MKSELQPHPVSTLVRMYPPQLPGLNGVMTEPGRRLTVPSGAWECLACPVPFPSRPRLLTIYTRSLSGPTIIPPPGRTPIFNCNDLASSKGARLGKVIAN